MMELLRPGGSLAWDYLWISTLFLGLGLAASAVLPRYPARAHRLLLLAILAALITPVVSQAARRIGWGILTAKADGDTPPILTSASPVVSRVSLPNVAMRPDDRQAYAPPVSARRSTGETRVSDLRFESRGITPMEWRAFLLVGWIVLAVLAAVRLVASLWSGLSVVRRAWPINDEALTNAAAASASRLGLYLAPELRASSRLLCPAIWCWGRRPLIVLPESADMMAAPVDWVAVFCHELAHWLRRDQWSSLFGEVLVCALPWHPLAWWARRRLGQLGELACDDWVLATGLPAADYAESLLRLVPQRRAPLALTAVSSRRGLFGRVRHILDERPNSPVIGRRWACMSGAVMVLAASALALAQSRPAESRNQIPNASSAAPPSQKETAMKHTIRGKVLGPDGKPAAGANVFWIGNPKPPVSFVALPKDRDSGRTFQDRVLAQAKADADGKFSLSADYDPDRYYHFNGWDVILLAKAPGAGMLSQPAKLDGNEVTLRLLPEVPIHGRLLTPAGKPASDVRVTLNGFYHDETREGMSVGLTPTDEEIPSLWPKALKTNADGRFVLHEAPQGTYVTLTFWHPDFAVDEVTVNTTADGSLSAGIRAFEITPVKPTFTHTLEPARPVQGRVTDKETGKPLAGLLIEMIPMRSHGGMPFHARTDADGRYRVSGHAGASFYITTVYPPADSGYLAASEMEQSWPAGAKFLEKNFALEKGRIVHGQVIDADTRRPVVGAAVVYQPKPGNPNNRNYDLRNTVLTDTAGRFAITALPGQGFLAVETPDESTIRVPVEGQFGSRTIFPQGHAAIDVPQHGEPKPAEIAVRKGVTLAAKAIGPDGKVVADVVGFCEGIDAKLIDIWDQGHLFADGVFRLPGADPSRIYRVYLLEPERGVGAVVDLKPADMQAGQPVEVKLERTAKVHGKVVAASGSPMQNIQVNPMLVIVAKEGEMSRLEVIHNTSFYSNLVGQKAMIAYNERQRSNSRGEFVSDTLLPGVRLYIKAASADGRWADVPVSPLKPGEDRDLGTITLKERR